MPYSIIETPDHLHRVVFQHSSDALGRLTVVRIEQPTQAWEAHDAPG